MVRIRAVRYAENERRGENSKPPTIRHVAKLLFVSFSIPSESSAVVCRAVRYRRGTIVLIPQYRHSAHDETEGRARCAAVPARDKLTSSRPQYPRSNSGEQGIKLIIFHTVHPCWKPENNSALRLYPRGWHSRKVGARQRSRLNQNREGCITSLDKSEERSSSMSLELPLRLSGTVPSAWQFWGLPSNSTDCFVRYHDSCWLEDMTCIT